MKDIDLNKIKKVHFVGIGGIGISAVARMFLLEGKRVSGSDGAESEIIDGLKKMGAKIAIEHSADNIKKDVDLVIYTIAITPDNLELLKTKEMGIPAISYPESLSLISKDKFTIAISGAHGKTTTTAMIGKMMIDAGLDPTVIVGSLIIADNRGLKTQIDADERICENPRSHPRKSASLGTNFIGGKSDYLVVEACEYRRSFLNINPTIAIITNIDDDHLDYYKDIKDIEKAFGEFVAKVPKNGFVVCDLKNKSVKNAVKKVLCTVIDYSKVDTTDLKLKVLGKHNIENAKVALAVAEVLGIDRGRVLRSLSEFSGTWRRFEYRGKTNPLRQSADGGGALVYDDYGHHPTEIKATLAGARELYPDKKIVVVFQPHLYSRTKDHLKEFGVCFREADEIVLLPIYAAREKDPGDINSEMVVAEIKKNGQPAYFVKAFDESAKLARKLSAFGDVIITLGAGESNKVADILTFKYKGQKQKRKT